MSGLLLALDGPANKDGPFIVATTNCFERLDEALTRVGRFNHQIKLDWSNNEQKESIYRMYYPEATASDVENLVANTAKKQISCAALVGFFRQMKLDTNFGAAEVAVEAKMLKSAKDVGGNRINLNTKVAPFLEDMGVSKQVIDILVEDGITTIRRFKHSQFSELIESIGKPDVDYNLTLKDLSVIAELISELPKKDKEGSEKNKDEKKDEGKDKDEKKDKNEDIKKDKEGSEKDKEKPEQANQVTKDNNKDTQEKEKLDLDAPVAPVLLKKGAHALLLKALELKGIITIRDFKFINLNQITTSLKDTKYKINLTDKIALKRAHDIAQKLIPEEATEFELV